MRNRQVAYGVSVALVWAVSLTLYAATGIGWWAAVPAGPAVLVLLAVLWPRRRGSGAGRGGDVASWGAPRSAAGSAPGRAASLPESSVVWEMGDPAGPPVVKGPVAGSAVLPERIDSTERDDDLVIVGSGAASRYRPLHEYAQDPLTPAAAETVATGLERLFLRLGPPPGSAHGPDQSAPAPRGDDR